MRQGSDGTWIVVGIAVKWAEEKASGESNTMNEELCARIDMVSGPSDLPNPMAYAMKWLTVWIGSDKSSGLEHSGQFEAGSDATVPQRSHLKCVFSNIDKYRSRRLSGID